MRLGALRSVSATWVTELLFFAPIKLESPRFTLSPKTMTPTPQKTKKATKKTTKATTRKKATKKAVKKKVTPESRKRARKAAKTAHENNRNPIRPDEMSGDLVEFITAIDSYKRIHERPFPSWSEVLEIVKALGYSRSA
jgi:hypothetical protein